MPFSRRTLTAWPRTGPREIGRCASEAMTVMWPCARELEPRRARPGPMTAGQRRAVELQAIAGGQQALDGHGQVGGPVIDARQQMEVQFDALHAPHGTAATMLAAPIDRSAHI
jgi:hypothetical protein